MTFEFVKIGLNWFCKQKRINMWYQGEEEEEEDLMCSPAILARRASESWINVPPVEVNTCHGLELILYLRISDSFFIDVIIAGALARW